MANIGLNQPSVTATLAATATVAVQLRRGAGVPPLVAMVPVSAVVRCTFDAAFCLPLL